MWTIISEFIGIAFRVPHMVAGALWIRIVITKFTVIGVPISVSPNITESFELESHS